MADNCGIDILILILIVLFTIFLMTFILNNKIEKEKELYQNDWAIYNYGQQIENKSGIAGIDINIRPIFNKINTKKDDYVIVAVVDTGVDLSNSNINKSILLNNNDTINNYDDDKNGFIDDYYGWNFFNNNNIIYEDALYDYHGTYVASTILKVFPCAKILPVKFLNSTYGTIEDSISAVKYAISRGAKIINCSWNFNDDSKELFELIKNHPEILFVCAAGNSNLNLDNQSLFPCSYDLDNIITVMAVDNKGLPYNSSGYGENGVDIAAPGVNVKTTLPDDEETLISGTSVASAYVSGTAALLLSQNPKLTPVDIKEILIENSHKINDLKSKCKSKGIIDVSASFQAGMKYKEDDKRYIDFCVLVNFSRLILFELLMDEF